MKQSRIYKIIYENISFDYADYHDVDNAVTLLSNGMFNEKMRMLKCICNKCWVKTNEHCESCQVYKEKLKLEGK